MTAPSSRLLSTGQLYTQGLDEASLNTASGYTKNLAAYSQTGSQWGISGTSTIISTTELAPDGTYTAVRIRPTLQWGGIRTQNACWLPNIPIIGSAWVRVNAGTRLLSFNLNGGGLNTVFTATSTWQRFNSTSYSKPVTYNDYFTVNDQNTTGFVDFIVWGIQVEKGTVITDYEPTGAAAVPLLPTGLTTKTTSGGNNYIAGEYDEVTYNPASGAKKNLIYNSTNFITNTNWRQPNSYLLSNSVLAPDGTMTGINWYEDNTFNGRYTETFYNASGGMIGGFSMAVPYTWSLYVKANGRNTAMLQIYDITTNNNLYATWNLTTGQLIGSAAATNSTYLSSTITPIVNGWYRVSVTGIPNTSGTSSTFYSVRVQQTSGIFQGDGQSGLFLWGPQLEIGTSPTTYVATSTTGVPLT